MRASGSIIRFVDVVLILWFGIIAISNTEGTSIPLPGSSNISQKPPPGTDEVLSVGIWDDGWILIENENIWLTNVDALRDHINEIMLARGSASFRVNIRPSRSAPVKYALAVASLCDELGLEKSLEVELRHEWQTRSK